MKTRIHFLLNERAHPEPNPVFVAAMGLLESDGFAISGCIPEEMLLAPERLLARHDLYVLKSQTELALSLACVLHDRGGRFLNPYPACALAQNKITAAARLAAGHVPVPPSWVTGDFDLLRQLVARHPLVVKPYRGHRGAGVTVVGTPAELARLPRTGEPVLVQEFIPGRGGDLKVYVVGEHVFAVRKTFSSESFRANGQPCPVTPQVRDIALRCGHAFGVGLYGIDLVEGPHGPVVVDFNHAPGFRGVPEAAPLIARHIAQAARNGAAAPVEAPVRPVLPQPDPSSVEALA
jgi:ribosomal protein S6--L-glutamate ligase